MANSTKYLGKWSCFSPEKSTAIWEWFPYSYGHLLVITAYKWDYTFYKWGFVSTYNWYFGP